MFFVVKAELHFLPVIQCFGLLAENAIGAVAVARKNFLFSDTPQGAEASALAFSIIGTATANELDPYEYLVHLFRNLPNLDFHNTPELLDSYMAWSEELPELCYTKKINNEAKEGI